MEQKLGNTIKIKRLSKNMSQEDISERVFLETGVSLNQSHLSDIEKGKVIPSFETLRVLLDILEIDWNVIKDLYVISVKDKSTLQKILLFFYEKGDFLFCNKVTIRIFQLLKKGKKLSKQDRRLWILTVFYILFYKGTNKLRLQKHVITMFANVS